MKRHLLPQDGTVLYFGRMFDKEKADWYLEWLMHAIE